MKIAEAIPGDGVPVVPRIVVPVPADADTPSFKTSIGTVKYAPERDAIVW